MLSNLASHLDFLKWQLGEANEAFREGTSVTNEYSIFNNTVQASIEKARKKVNELAIELGEKLYPMMKHIYSSSSAFLKVLGSLVDFIIEHRKAIGFLVTVLASYYGSQLAVKTITLVWHGVLAAGKTLMTAYRVAVVYSRIAVIAFTQGVGAASHAMKLLNTVLKANPLGLLLAAVAAVYTAIKILTDNTSEFTKKMREAKAMTLDYTKELFKEMETIDKLIGKLEGAKKGSDEYKNIKSELIKQYGKYLKGLIDEKGEINNLTAAYNRLAAAARASAKERAIELAKETAGDAFDESFKDLGEKLQNSLMSAGQSLRDATRISSAVMYQLRTTGTLSADLVKQIEDIQYNGLSLGQRMGFKDTPVAIVQKMINNSTEYRETISAIEDIDRYDNPIAHYNEQQLKMLIDEFKPLVEAGKTGRIIIGIDKANPEIRNLTVKETAEFLHEAEAKLSEIATTAEQPDMIPGNPEFSYEDYTPYETDADKRKRLAEERAAAAAAKREETKAKREFKEELNKAKGKWEAADTQKLATYNLGYMQWIEFLSNKQDNLIAYYDELLDIYKKWNLQEDEDFQETTKKKEEAVAAWDTKFASISVEQLKFEQRAKENQAQMDYVTPGSDIYQNEEALNKKLFEIREFYLILMSKMYKEGSEEHHNYGIQIEEADAAEKLRIQQRYAKLLEEWREKYDSQAAANRRRLEIDVLEELRQAELISTLEYQLALEELNKKYAQEALPDSAKPKEQFSQAQLDIQRLNDLAKVDADEEAGILTHEQAEKARDRINEYYAEKQIERVRQFGSEHTNQLLDIYQAWKDFFEKSEEDGENWVSRLATLAQAVFAVMGAGLSQMSDYIQAEANLEVARVEKKYELISEFAEGNAYREAKAEKEKEKEIARIKSDVSRKQFAMQVAQAVANTATNALMAYGSAQVLPYPMSQILGAFAAALATAQGMAQIAIIKKQQQVSQAQGYSSGGFTPAGRIDEPVGIVHAGEWVASQKLVNSPQTRPLLEALDYAQRNNTIGSIRMADVSRSVTAPMLLASQPSTPAVNVNVPSPTVVVEQNSEYADTMRRLAQRLNEPFVTVNTVSGDHGIQKAQDDYNRLLRNKTPKYRR